MKIELKNLKHARFASQETDCFVATVYVDGVKAGTAENAGHGGATTIRPRALEEKLEAYAATLPMADLRLSDAEVRTYQPTAETVIGDALEAWLVERDLRKTLSKCVVFTMPGRAEVLKSKVVPAQRLRLALQDPAKVREQLGGADKILNLLPLAEAVAILRAALRTAPAMVTLLALVLCTACGGSVDDTESSGSGNPIDAGVGADADADAASCPAGYVVSAACAMAPPDHEHVCCVPEEPSTTCTPGFVADCLNEAGAPLADGTECFVPPTGAAGTCTGGKCCAVSQ